jgi:hypothetical protein
MAASRRVDSQPEGMDAVLVVGWLRGAVRSARPFPRARLRPARLTIKGGPQGRLRQQMRSTLSRETGRSKRPTNDRHSPATGGTTLHQRPGIRRHLHGRAACATIT